MKLARLAKSSIALFSESSGLYIAPESSLVTSSVKGGISASSRGNSLSRISQLSDCSHSNSEASSASLNTPVNLFPLSNRAVGLKTSDINIHQVL